MFGKNAVKKAAPAKKAAGKAEKVEKTARVTIEAIAFAAILEDKDKEGVIKAVKSKFPGARTSDNSINWYRNKLRVSGKLDPRKAAEKKASAKGGKKAPPAKLVKNFKPKTKSSANSGDVAGEEGGF